MDNNYILTLKNITKEFPGVKALDDVTINIERGTIHGLVGENGAGKSTLIKVLAGIYQPNKGEIILDGKPCRFNSPIEARRAGISVVHQEIKLAEPLSVAENMFLGNVQLKNGLVDWKGMRRRAREIVEDLGMDIDINAHFAKTMWCGNLACELAMKELAGVSSRCIPFNQEKISDVCPVCGKPAKHMVYWGVAY